MATVQRSSAKAPSKPQYESFVEQQLSKASQRIRAIDLLGSGAILLSLVLGYGLAVGLADRLWDLPTGIRLVGWVFLVIGLAVFVGSVLNRLCLRRVNPVFLARQLEQTVPDAKNSVINWLNLQNEPLPSVIRGSLGRRAAKDLTEADTDEAISARPLWWLGGVAGVLFLIQLSLLIASPSQALSLLGRAFVPFEKKAIANRTELTLVEPEGGDASVLAHQPVRIRVRAAGHVPSVNQPDSLKVHFRYTPNEPFEVRPLTQDVDGQWTTVVLADQVRNGFFYKITGGDARLPEDREYRVDVRSLPHVTRFEVHHQYRPYLVLPVKKVVYEQNVRPSITEMRGTKTTLVVRTNRDLQQCVLDLKSGAGRTELPGEAVAGDPRAWQFTWVLDQSGEFRILFKSKDGEDNVDRQASKITVLPDRAPEVVITKPAADVTLPANGTLLVEGYARDDFGVRSLRLRLKALKPQSGPELKAKDYDVALKLVNGKYLLDVDYKDFIALDAVQTAKGEPFPLTPGMELEYWLEARDNCDYPAPDGNLGLSKRYKVTIAAPEKNKDKVQQDRAAAQGQQQQAKKNVNSSVDDHNAQAKAQENAAKDQPGNQSGAGGNTADDVKKAIDEQKQKEKGEAKGGDNQSGAGQGQSKPDPQQGGNDAGSSQGAQPGEGSKAGQEKDGGKQGANESGDSKGPGQQQSNQTGASKQSPPGAGQQPPGNQKGDGPKDNGAGADKGGPPHGQQSGAGDSKNNAGGSADSKTKDGGGGMQTAKGGEKGPPADMKDAGAGTGKGSGDTPDTATGKKADSKGNPMGDASAGKASTEAPQQSDATAKGPGQPDAAKGGQPGAGDVKGASSANEKTAKTAPTDSQATAKSSEGPDKNGTANKLPPPGDAGGKSKSGDRGDASMSDVAELAKQMEDPGQREGAKHALEKISDEARDPKVSEAADKALQQVETQGAIKNAKEGAMNASGGQGKGTPNDAKDSAAAKTAKNDASAGTQKDGSGSGKAGDTKGQSKKSGAGTPGPNNKGSVGGDDLGAANPLDQSAANRPDELQLELLKKKIDKLRSELTPPVLEKLKWTEKDREDFLRQLRDDALLRQARTKAGKDNPPPPPGSIQARISSPGPRTIGPDNRGPGGQAPTAIAEPPPDVRLANKIFQSK